MRIEDDYTTNNYKDERSILGNFFYTITMRQGNFLMRHLWLYYFLHYTWGLLYTLLGWCILGFIKVFFKKYLVEYSKIGPCRYIMLLDNWGGLELGVNFLIADNMGEYWTYHLKCHEMGHTFQNAIYGPFAIFLIYIPSAIRYWYQEFRSIKNKQNKNYDCIWFEESATDIGHKYYNDFLS